MYQSIKHESITAGLSAHRHSRGSVPSVASLGGRGVGGPPRVTPFIDTRT